MLNKIIARAHHYLNLVSQDSTVAASLLIEDATFYDMLMQYAQGTDDTLAYANLMSYVSNNF